jgi:hypothetical protein
MRSDFFVQGPDEPPVDDVLIIYGIADNNWRPTPDSPEKEGIKHQHWRKEKGGNVSRSAARSGQPPQQRKRAGRSSAIPIQ